MPLRAAGRVKGPPCEALVGGSVGDAGPARGPWALRFRTTASARGGRGLTVSSGPWRWGGGGGAGVGWGGLSWSRLAPGTSPSLAWNRQAGALIPACGGSATYYLCNPGQVT